MTINNTNKKQQGFVILFSILVSTIILLMSAGIFRIAQKESVLSSYSRESQVAFYAADSGLECALYWDISRQISETKFRVYDVDGTVTNFNCGTDASGDSQTIPSTKYGVVGGQYAHAFGFRYANLDADAGCSFVFVEKNNPVLLDPANPETSLSTVETRVTAVGYNACNGNIPDIDDPTLLERRLTVQYTAL